MSRDADTGRVTYDRFVEFERLVNGYPSVGRRINPKPIGYAAFALTLFVYSMNMCGATIPIPTSPAMGMGLALFYGGLIQLIAGVYELRSGNNFHALVFCSYAGFWLGLASIYVQGSFNFATQVQDSSVQNDFFGIFFLAWTIFTLAVLIASIRTNIGAILFFFFLLLTYILFTASYYLNGHQNLARAAGAVGIFTAVIGWYKAFAHLLVKGENSYVTLPLYDISRRRGDAAGANAVEMRVAK
ncbi:unnamed protein product [Adineta steineri]|uniref:Uncharacterized protein n=1 Tax=Adineta steineri TaxID=433720 RepID=A0A813MEG9_9BILA|nr:unnamed protein product [Adineta steineri]CAF0769793.1 unnamed protein product [Adineta steineri]CAF3894665.1 unnamed protein product [Adineta steineri]CAF3999977.1 unnamed protein product [Adineta steineri]